MTLWEIVKILELKKSDQKEIFDTKKFEGKKYDKTEKKETIDYLFFQLNEIIKSQLSEYNLPKYILDIPSRPWSDFVIATKDFFDLNKELWNINAASEKIFEKINSIDWLQVQKQWIFINIFLTKNFLNSWLNQVFDKNFWEFDFWHWVVAIDYSSPNIWKQLSIGHIRSTMLGEVVARMLEKAGKTPVRWNYLWDWWTNFWKLLYSFVYHFDEKLLSDLKTDPNTTLWKIYSSFKDIPDEDKEQKARDFFKLLESWDEDAYALYEYVKQTSIKDFVKTYKLLGIDYDYFLGEHFAQQYVPEIMKLLKEKNILHFDQDAYVVKLDENFIPIKVWEEKKYDPQKITVFILEKSDWTTIYGSRDLASSFIRAKIADECLYIVWHEQSLHFKSIFGIINYLNFFSLKNLKHLAFGLILLEGSKMSSRKWNIFRLADMIDDVTAKIKSLDTKNLDADTAQKLALSAIFFNDLKNDRSKDINFDVDAMTRISGDTGVYLQYSYVRIKHLLEKLNVSSNPEWNEKFENNSGGFSTSSKWQMEYEWGEVEKLIIVDMIRYPLVFERSLQEYKPHILAQYILWFSQKISAWYSTSEKILDLENSKKTQIAILLKWAMKIYENIFWILMFPRVEKM